MGHQIEKNNRQLGRIAKETENLRKQMRKPEAGVALVDFSTLTFDAVEVVWFALDIMRERAFQLASLSWIVAHAAIGGWMSLVSLMIVVPASLAASHGIRTGVQRVKGMLPMQPWLGLCLLFIGLGSLPGVFS